MVSYFFSLLVLLLERPVISKPGFNPYTPAFPENLGS